MENVSENSYFETVREQLRYWPYTIHQVDDTLDADLIEGRARQILFQALNSRQITVFAGSGLAAAFGRLTWSGWEDEQLSVVTRGAAAFLETAENSVKWINCLIKELNDTAGGAEHGASESVDQNIVRLHNVTRWLRSRRRQIEDAHSRVERLYQTFHRCKAEGAFPGGDGQPVKFEIAQQLHEALGQFVQLFLAPVGLQLQTDRKDQTWPHAWPGSFIPNNGGAPREALDDVAKTLQAAMNGTEANSYRISLETLHLVMSAPTAQTSLEDLAKLLLFDECGHARQLLRAGLLQGQNPKDIKKPKQLAAFEDLERELKIFDRKWLRRDIQGIREAPERYRILSAFGLKRVEQQYSAWQRSGWRSKWTSLMGAVADDLGHYIKVTSEAGTPRQFLTPTSRFLAAAWLCLQDNPDKLIADIRKELPDVAPADFKSRQAIIDARLDPMERVVRDLGIRRFITTNYDFEIERYFIDAGYRRFAPNQGPANPTHGAGKPLSNDAMRTDDIGGIMRDETFERHRASDLVRFAIDDKGDEAAVFHLHGRATAEDTLVITERNYMNLYLWQDQWRDTVNEGITMAFSGAPILFLGLGMSEADLLRPLRQFMSNRDRSIGYHAIALLPAEKPLDARTKLSASLYLRYGVHTIFYGGGQVEIDDQFRDIDWLCRIMLLIDGLSDLVKDLEGFRTKAKDNDPFDMPKKTAMFKRLIDKVDFVGKDLEGYPKDKFKDKLPSALMVLLGVLDGADRTSFDDPAKLKAFADHATATNTRLATCRFTPFRNHSAETGSKHKDDSTSVDGADFVGFYTRRLTEVLQLVLGLKKNDLKRSSADRELAALRIILDGLRGGFLTGCLNAALEGLHRGWASWWEKWQQSPDQRLAEFERLPSAAKSSVFLPARYVRHHVDNVLGKIKDLDHKEVCKFAGPQSLLDAADPKRLNEGLRTGLRSFDTFISSIAERSNLIRCQEQSAADGGRVMFTLLAHRGLGKGSLLSALASDRGMSLYQHAVWGKPLADKTPTVIGAAFVNLSFATEIASAYDMLVDAIAEATAMVELAQNDRKLLAGYVHAELGDAGSTLSVLLKDAKKAILRKLSSLSRLSTMSAVVDRFGKASARFATSTGLTPRFLLCIGGMDLMFDQLGQPKNIEIKRILSRLLGPRLAPYPFDLVMMGSEDGLGAPFSNQPDPWTPTHYRIRLDRKDLGPDALEHIGTRLREGRVKVDLAPGDGDLAGCLLRGDNWDAPSRTDVSRQRKRVSLPADRTPRPLKRCHVNFLHFARPPNVLGLLLDNFPVLATGLCVVPGGSRNELKDDFDNAVKEGRKLRNEAISALWKGPNASPNANDTAAAQAKIWEKVKERLQIDSPPVGIDEPDQGLKAMWRDVRRRLGANRFSLTILMAAAEHIVVSAETPSGGAERAKRFINATVDQVRNAGLQQREDIVLQAVLDLYRRSHQIGDPDRDMDLQNIILRHLGAIGSPVSVNVLVRLPEFRDYFDRIGIELETSRSRFIMWAMTTVAYRGLVFRLTPHPHLKGVPSQGMNAPVEYRYVLHRIVQRYAVSRIGATARDSVSKDDFAPTLFAGMRSTGVGLSQESYQFIRSLMIALSQYPDIPQNDDSLRPWAFTTEQDGVRVQAVRGALSLARSTLSVPMISQLKDQDISNPGHPKRGYMESYKVRLRWIIRMAWEIPGDATSIKALYRDEIVWLYNELGVIGLTQGNLNEALAFFRQAAELNEPIEGRARSGPIYDRLDVNHAIVQFERGRIDSAQSRLLRVLEATQEDQSLLHWIVQGYLCVINHVTAKECSLVDAFEQVTEKLLGLGEHRASATMLLHRGQHLSGIDQAGAAEVLKQAQSLAEVGGHEDLRLRIELARLIAEYSVDGNSDIAPRAAGSSRAGSKYLSRLAEIEEYGRRMWIWGLQAEALRLRANYLLLQGETSSAGSLAVRSMAISGRNRMMLRLNSALTIYAQILANRGDIKGAIRNARLSLELARTSKYNIELSRVRHVLGRIDPNGEP